MSKDGFFHLVTQFPQVGIEVMSAARRQAASHHPGADRGAGQADELDQRPRRRLSCAARRRRAALATGPRRAARSSTGWSARRAFCPTAAACCAALCERLVAAGLPLARASFHVRILHPQLFGIGYYWQRGSDEIRVFRAEHGIQETSVYQQSPMRILFEGAGAVRQRLDLPDVAFRFPLFDELRDEGLTDYVALPVTFSDGKIHGTTWSSDPPGGFTTGDLAQIYDLLPAFSLLLEIYLNRRIAITLLDTYVGHAAGERILRGQITRGSGETVRAAIWFCDLRGFTALAERLDRDRLLACLNQYFDRMAKPVQDHGGEILKFIGDAMLAVFPLDTSDACRRALQAALDARSAMAELNRRAAGAGRGGARVRHRAARRRRDVRQHRRRRPPRLHGDRAGGQPRRRAWRGCVARSGSISWSPTPSPACCGVRRLALARDATVCPGSRGRSRCSRCPKRHDAAPAPGAPAGLRPDAAQARRSRRTPS